MRFDIITIFPEVFESYLNASMIKRARAKKLVDIRIHDLRNYVKVAPRPASLSLQRGEQARGNLPLRRQVDDRPYGGGPGMVLKVEPIIKAIEKLLKPISNSQFPISKRKKVKIILFSAAGKQFDAKIAADFAKKYDRIVMIAGHYEGIDERIGKIIFENWKLEIENLSVGPYVLTGGELPALVVVDAVSRHIPGFLGKAESLEEKRYGVGLPVYTRPEVFSYKGKKYHAPKILLSGDHKKIEIWRRKQKRDI
ncbi:MAG: tRNA (guanosine(37)-N1)-methyltransferase TrmD [Candidatus Sungbacteria bacterium]|nr:tRNA (guanosine(37)-N1)-methyltransferase TrmD [Candidatus Sungbacteria bacterium]